ncbi:MFS transporter [Streptomyces chromofuscus]|uniref:MFS transporter n=1 Tax=Streptomyces chromofuscus TaxID=42881 RepID=UPI0019B48C0F|nr:MFS transporter [Streptomyces chromofuscus]GGT03703.1 MFS transporter [Streptomyces chromofuscus]
MSSQVPRNASVRLDDLIDQRPVGRFHYLLLALTGSVMFLDGLDTQAMSYAAPEVAQEWHLSPSALGPILSASIAGLMVGYLLLAPLAGRTGHRKLIIWSVTWFGVLTLLCAVANSEPQLLALRFLTGAGLGAAIPSAVSLASEYAPARRRSTFVMHIYCWLALGFVAAGLISRVVIPAWGWRAVFAVGGALPLLLATVLLRALPDSPTYLLRHGADHSAVHATLRRLAPDLSPDTRVLAPEAHRADAAAAAHDRAPLLELFRRHRLLGTMLLWLAFMLNLAVFYAMQSWLPTVLAQLGHSASTAVAATALTTVGGIVAAMFIGPSMDRHGAFGTLGLVYLIGAVFVALFAVAIGGGAGGLLVAAFLAGTCVTGGQMSVIALATVLYPPRIRSTGVGWALGIGRIGGIAGPLLVGLALDSGVPVRSVFLVMAAAFLLASLVVAALSRASRDGRSAKTAALDGLGGQLPPSRTTA